MMIDEDAIDELAKQDLDRLHAILEERRIQPGEWTLAMFMKREGKTRAEAESIIKALLEDGTVTARDITVGRDRRAYRLTQGPAG